jgi:hypothetical protein
MADSVPLFGMISFCMFYSLSFCRLRQGLQADAGDFFVGDLRKRAVKFELFLGHGEWEDGDYRFQRRATFFVTPQLGHQDRCIAVETERTRYLFFDFRDTLRP